MEPKNTSNSGATVAPISDADLAYTKKLPFGVLCDLFTVISSTNKRSIKKAALEKLLNKYRLFYMYPVMRLLLPHLDRDRQTYSLKESKLAKIFVQILAISKDNPDALRMINWKQPQKNPLTGKHEGGDFAEAVYNCVKTRCATQSTSTIHSINAHLDSLNACEDNNQRIQILTKLLRQATAYEIKWIIRIILKDLKIGISEALVFEVFHEDATELYNITSSLYLVCNQLRDPAIRTSHQGISLFHPIKPMLAGRKLPEDIGTLMSNNRRFVIEQKFDGERVQVHKEGNIIRMFSRNSLEVTDIYPMIRYDLQMAIKANQAIIDGELLVWDRETKEFEPFGKAKTQAKEERDSNIHPSSSSSKPSGAQKSDANKESIQSFFAPKQTSITSTTGQSQFAQSSRESKQFCFIAFDVLYLDGETKMNMPLRSRIELLHKLIHVREKVVEIVTQTEVLNELSVIEALNHAIDHRHEGIMVKDINSIYVPNERKDKWTKLKPEYMDGIGDTLDLIILGGLYGSGVRKGATISHFLLGVQKSPGVYWSVARVGSGYSDSELRTLQAMLQNYWKPYNPANPPKGIELAESGNKDIPNVWIDPKYSRVVEVLAAQITPSEKYKAGYTLRFPRVKRVRLDKVADQVTTMDELLQMVSLYESKSSRNKLHQNTAKEIKSSKKQKGDSIFHSHGIRGLAYKKLDENPEMDKLLMIHGSIFVDKEFCIINGDSNYRKESLETLIKNQGGTIVQNPTSRTFCAIAGRLTVNVRIVESKATTNVVWLKWLIACITKQVLLPLEPRFMIYTEPNTLLKFKQEIDRFGDTYERDTDTSTLQDLFSGINLPYELDEQGNVRKKDKLQQVKPENQAGAIIKKEDIVKKEMIHQAFSESNLELPEELELPDYLSFEETYFGRPWWALFRNCHIYVDKYDDVSTKPRHPDSSLNNSITASETASVSNSEHSPELHAHQPPSTLDIAALTLKFYGAIIYDHIDYGNRLTHILIDSKASRHSLFEGVIEKYRLKGENPIMVNEKWLERCLESKKLMSEEEWADSNLADLLGHD